MNRRAALALAFGLTAALTAAGCSSGDSASGQPELSVSGGYMPQPVSGLGAGFLVITNSGGAADKLTSVTGDISDDITIHKTENQKMTRVASFDIPAQGRLDLERGGSHIMFTDLKRRPRQGENVSIELHFEKTAPLTVELPVKEPNYNPARQ